MDGDARLLAAMPLHAITATYGEAGLRQRFAAEVASFPAVDADRLSAALALAARLHAADRRQREPYVNHLLRVAIRVLSHYQVRDADVVCAALLHDAAEDHSDELAAAGGPAGGQDAERADGTATGGAGGREAATARQAAALRVLAERFGSRVAELVAAVTNPPAEPGRDRHQQYRDQVAASLERCPWARVVKVSDFTDNGVGLIHSTGPTLTRLAGKYAPLVPVLADLVARPDTPLSAEVKQRILDQLGQAARRFAVLLPEAVG